MWCRSGRSLASSTTIVAPRCERGSSEKLSTSGCCSSGCWTIPRCTPIPRPWTSSDFAESGRVRLVDVFLDDGRDVTRLRKGCRSSSGLDRESRTGSSLAFSSALSWPRSIRRHRGRDPAANREVSRHGHSLRPAGADEIVQDLVGDRLVEDPLVRGTPPCSTSAP